MNWFYAGLCLLCTLALASGQILFKLGAVLLERSSATGTSFHVWTNGYLLSALLLYALSTILWIWILRRVPLSIAYPFTALAYVIVPVAASSLLEEPINSRMIIGSLLIVTGVFVVGSTKC